jgi:broad specificity phosphatase PhoE
MPTLTLVRHGQASFGADDYDQLSPLGMQQAEALGAYMASQGLQFDAVLHGTLRRHVQTWQGMVRGAGDAWKAHTPTEWPGLNEYDSEAVIAAIHPAPLSREKSPEVYRHHFRLLREGLAAWMQGRVQPRGMPAYADWLAGITGALDHVRTQHGAKDDAHILIVSSGGPISTAVGHVLGTSPETTIELNLRIRNTSLTEFAFTPKRHMLVSYNHLPHLQGKPDWITYA